MKIKTCTFILLALTFCRIGFADFDALDFLNTGNFDGNSAVWIASNGNTAAELSFDSVRLENTPKIFGMSVPKGVLISNLKLVAYLDNIGANELWEILSSPWVPVAAEGFSMELKGKKATVKFRASRASLAMDKSVNLSGKIEISCGETVKSLGDDAQISLRGRKIIVSSGGKSFAFKF